MRVWKHYLCPCFQTNLICIASACSRCASLVVPQHGDWPAVSPRRGPERPCTATAQAAQQWWRDSCLSFSSKPPPDVASGWKSLTHAEFPEKGHFPKGKMRRLMGLKAIFQTDSGKKKVTFHNGRPPWCASKLLIHLFISSTDAFGVTKLASPQSLNLISPLIKSRVTAGEATISVSKQQYIGISSSCLVEQEIIVLLLLSWPSPFLCTDSYWCEKASKYFPDASLPLQDFETEFLLCSLLYKECLKFVAKFINHKIPLFHSSVRK